MLVKTLVNLKVFLKPSDKSLKLLNSLSIFDFLIGKSASHSLEVSLLLDGVQPFQIFFIEFEICFNKLLEEHLIVSDKAG